LSFIILSIDKKPIALQFLVSSDGFNYFITFITIHHRYSFDQFSNYFGESETFKAPPPLNVTIMKGTRYVVLKRDFAQFVISEQANNRIHSTRTMFPSNLGRLRDNVHSI
jgi:hypothetical protein